MCPVIFFSQILMSVSHHGIWVDAVKSVLTHLVLFIANAKKDTKCKQIILPAKVIVITALFEIETTYFRFYFTESKRLIIMLKFKSYIREWNVWKQPLLVISDLLISNTW